ncbi:MAG: hypothetical protein H7222_13525 [Methylotenera sp.]|nr:hypothetical protein [Oligoflexia bacterium]
MDRNSRQKNSVYAEPEHELLRAAAKSLWKNRYRYRFSFYCPLCRIPRRIGQSPRPLFSHFVQIGVTSAFITMLSWNWYGPKGMVTFLPLWILFETIYRARMRAALKCNSCGFDPNLYLVDVQKAKAGVEKYWKVKFVEKGISHPKYNPASAGAAEGSEELKEDPVPRARDTEITP